jgi:hypothetical protein
MESILTSTKKLSGVMKEDEHFDEEIIMYINSVFLILRQLGVGPSEGFVITGVNETWRDFLPDDKDRILRESVKSYMGAKVCLQFDPPTNSTLLDAKCRIVDEFEWRLNIEADPII